MHHNHHNTTTKYAAVNLINSWMSSHFLSEQRVLSYDVSASWPEFTTKWGWYTWFWLHPQKCDPEDRPTTKCKWHNCISDLRPGLVPPWCGDSGTIKGCWNTKVFRDIL